MKTQQSGFTLIELVVVIVILGILAAVAIPKFIDLRAEANDAAASGFAGALNSASALNYAGCMAKNNTAATGKCTVLSAATATCSNIGALVVPAVTFTVGAVPATTVQGTLYLATDSALTTAGATCTFVYGDGGAGVTKTFMGLATGA